MKQLIKRKIGRILLDGGFMSNRELDRALVEQTHTKELLGHVLVRMGVVKERDFKVPLILQRHLNDIEDAVKIAAGERELLGMLLVHSGHITKEQLDQAIAEQKKSGQRLGEVFIRLGMLQERQLTGLLDFQSKQQEHTRNPLRLGELLVATGHISRKQLNDAILKQSITHKKLGEILVDEGYVRPSLVKYGICMQKMLVGSVLAGIISLGGASRGFASSVVLQWDPSTGTEVTGYKVYTSPGSTPLTGSVPMDVQAQTTTTISGLDPTQSHQFAVTAYNVSGSESAFSNVVSIPEQSAPTVSISSPSGSINVSGTVLISVNASDNVGVSKVEFYVNGVLKATDTATPYVYSWDTTTLAPGAYTLMAKAYDAAGNIGQSATSTVTVVNDVTPPTVAVTSPVNNAIVSGTVIINSSASDNVGVSKVEFYANGVFLYASNVSPYSFSWDTKGVANGTYTLYAKAYDNVGNSVQSSFVTVTVNNSIVTDTIAPTLSSFILPATSTSLTVPVSGFSASDNSAVTGYMITESSTKPSAVATGWSSSAPSSFTFSSAGVKTAYAWAKDAAGNVSNSSSASVTITVASPVIPAATTLTAWSASTVPGIIDSGPDAAVELGVKFRSDVDSTITGVRFYKAGTNTGTHTGNLWDSTGKLLATATFANETASGWQQVNFTTPVAITANTVYVASYHSNAGHYSDDQNFFAGKGVDNGSLHLLADGVSGPSGVYMYGTASKFPNQGWNSSNYWVDVVCSTPATGTIAQPDVTAPTLSSFTLPSTATSLTVPVSGLSASDNSAVTGYMITESSTKPSAGATGWSSSAPSSFTFSSAGVKTAYAWAKDAAGNVSNSSSASVTITLPDTIAPTLSSFTLPATSTSLTVPVSGFSASDNSAVTGYMITESSTKPSAGATGWSSSAPSSFTFSSAGVKTAYAWAKDAAGNVSNSSSASVTITLPDTIAPTLSSFTLPATSTSLTVPVSGFSASDNSAVTGYMITESSTKPSAVATGWSSSAPSSFTFSSAGVKTAYAWAKDAAGNVSSSRSATVTITQPDVTVPTVTFSNLVANSIVSGTVSVTASAFDSVGVSSVEFYVNNMLNASTTASPYTFNWDTVAFANGLYSLTARAYDAAGNVGQSALVTVTVDNPVIPAATTLTAWSASTVPGIIDSGPDAAVELGVKFRSDVDSTITGVRFYKAGTNTGTHTGNLWDSTGKLLATATFANETASGWQQVNFTTPVAITANTVYVASYHSNAGHYSDDQNFFAGKGVDNGSLHLLADGVSGPSGVYMYGTASKFPNQGWNSSNYWVDVVCSTPATGTIAQPDVTAPTLSSFTLPSTATSLTVPVSGLSASDNSAVTGYMITESSTKPSAGATGWSSSAPSSFTFSSAGVKTAYAWAKDAAGNVSNSSSASVTITLPDTIAPTLSSFILPATATSLTVPVSGFSASDNSAVTGYMITESSTKPSAGATGWSSSAPSSFTFSSAGVKTAYAWAKDAAGNVSNSSSASVTITVASPVIPAATTLTAWSASTVPGIIDSGPDAAVELGVKFRSDSAGYITGVRFYKAGTNTGTHTGNLWDSTGKLLATATFANETASGWQQVNFTTPVAIAANTVYVASYHSNAGHYSDDQNFFAGKGVDNGSLHLLADGVSGPSGVYMYGTASKFPSQGWNSSNYWVDVVFNK